MASDPEGLVVLREVRSRSEDPAERAAIAASLANSLGLRVGAREAAALVEESMEEIGDASGLLGIGLRAEMLRLLVLGLERVPDGFLLEVGEGLRPQLPVAGGDAGAGPGACDRPRTAGAGSGPSACRDRRSGGRDERRDGWLPATGSIGRSGPGRPRRPHRRPLRDRDRGRAPAWGDAGNSGEHGIRGLCRYLDGELGEAQADAELAVRLSEQVDLEAVRSVHASMAVRTLVARGEMAAAEAMAADPWRGDEPPAGIPAAMLLCARGELLLASGRPAEAKQRFLAAADEADLAPSREPGGPPLADRPGAQRGGPGRARGRGSGGHRRGRGGAAAGATRGPSGIALRARGLASEGDERVARLGESVECSRAAAPSSSTPGRWSISAPSCAAATGGTAASRFARGWRSRTAAVRWPRRAGSRGAGRRRRAAAQDGALGGRRADPERAAGGADGGDRDDESRDRPGPVRDPADGRGAPDPHLPEARRRRQGRVGRSLGHRADSLTPDDREDLRWAGSVREQVLDLEAPLALQPRRDQRAVAGLGVALDAEQRRRAVADPPHDRGEVGAGRGSARCSDGRTRGRGRCASACPRRAARPRGTAARASRWSAPAPSGGCRRCPASASAACRRWALAQAYSLPRTPRRWRTSSSEVDLRPRRAPLGTSRGRSRRRRSSRSWARISLGGGSAHLLGRPDQDLVERDVPGAGHRVGDRVGDVGRPPASACRRSAPSSAL